MAGYEANIKGMWRETKDGPERMSNFQAWITREVRIIDGANSVTTLTLAGQIEDPEKPGEVLALPETEVSGDAFPSMQWVMNAWGVRCVISPGSGVKEDLRAAIQYSSKPAVQIVYRQTGWVMHNKRRVYLHAGGAIGANGNDPTVTVRLPPELMRYDLTTATDPAEAVRASLDLLGLTERPITWPLLCGTLAPLTGPVDFGMHVTGRTGSFKSELMSLFQSHYGPTMDARHLPGSWSSTANALEALAYYAANAAFTLDDFVPTGTSWQQRAYQQSADKIIRAQGNQAGRARLTDTANLQQTMYPRGIILSTGEDTPEGHSVRARLLIMELSAGMIEPEDLTHAQRMRPKFVGTVAWFAQTLAAEPFDWKPRMEQLRAELRTIGHSRTPGMLGRLIATGEEFTRRAAAAGFISAAEANALAAECRANVIAAGHKQAAFLEDADPVDVFSAAIRQCLAVGSGHIRSLNGGVPELPLALGWVSEKALGEMASYKSRGPCIGWADTRQDLLFLDVTGGFPVIKKTMGADMSLSKQTLFKRLKEAGLLVRVDETRARNTVRVTAENHPRQALCLSLTSTLQLEDVTRDRNTKPGDFTDAGESDEFGDEWEE